MYDPVHYEILNKGVGFWNEWRAKNKKIMPNLRKVVLSGRRLCGANLSKTNLRRAILRKADLSGANIRRANVSRADLSGADLSEAIIRGANLDKANLSGACLNHADLSKALLIKTNLKGANLECSRLYGASVWVPETDNQTNQHDLIITDKCEPAITVDNLEVAQFIYLLLKNEKLRDVIGTIGKKGVLILGRFTEERIKILHAIRDELRCRYNLLPIMFEFDPLADEPTIKTLSTLAHLSRFVIADLTDAKSILQELAKILHEIPTLPVKPIIHKADNLPPMGDSFFIMQSMLRPYVYDSKKKLIEDLKYEIINPAEDCIKKFEAELSAIRQKWFPWQQE